MKAVARMRCVWKSRSYTSIVIWFLISVACTWWMSRDCVQAIYYNSIGQNRRKYPWLHFIITIYPDSSNFNFQEISVCTSRKYIYHLSRKYINTVDNKLFTNTVSKNAKMKSFKGFCLLASFFLEIFNFAWHENIKHVTSHCRLRIFAPRLSLALVCCRWRGTYGSFLVFIGENYFWHTDKGSYKKPGFLILYIAVWNKLYWYWNEKFHSINTLKGKTKPYSEHLLCFLARCYSH